MSQEIKDRLEYLRGEIIAERISYGEIVELQSLAEHIDEGDVMLLEWTGANQDNTTDYCTVCAVRTFGSGWENGLCDTCWDNENRHG